MGSVMQHISITFDVNTPGRLVLIVVVSWMHSNPKKSKIVQI